MVAFVTKTNKIGRRHSIKTVSCDKLCVVIVGDRVSKRRLNKKLARFGNDIIVSHTFTTISSRFSGDEFKTQLLFNAFCEFVNSASLKYSVGILDNDGQFLKDVGEILPKAKSLSVCSLIDTEPLLSDCIKDFGVAPEVSSSVDVLDGVDVVFAPRGFYGQCEFLFGEGGFLPSAERFPLPDYCALAVSLGADRLELAALLSAEEPLLSIEGLVPEFMQKGQEVYRLSALEKTHRY